jgi:hypothetical protein
MPSEVQLIYIRIMIQYQEGNHFQLKSITIKDELHYRMRESRNQ